MSRLWERRDMELLRSVAERYMQYLTYHVLRATLIAYSFVVHSSRYFMWLDEFTANIANEAAGRVGEQEQDVGEHFGRIELKIMMHDLEERVAALEKKKFMSSFYVIAMLLALLYVYFVKVV
ncbi:hypothetical protein PIB30_047377 [Stylosanthes scabra]|uniref:Uncharacterized protein n=1 Tax=Stylosanthes scabra TaxID=79078 RepID=A0ABU6XFS3_9FABA|nr:hypothetical protein [Stylosanthes scabra]